MNSEDQIDCKNAKYNLIPERGKNEDIYQCTTQVALQNRYISLNTLNISSNIFLSKNGEFGEINRHYLYRSKIKIIDYKLPRIKIQDVN